MAEVVSERPAYVLAAEHDGAASPSLLATLAAQAADQRRELAGLRGEVVALRAQVGDLALTLERAQQQLRQLDRDNLRAEERDRELLQALDESRQRDRELLYAAIERLREPRRWWWNRGRTRGCAV